MMVLRLTQYGHPIGATILPGLTVLRSKKQNGIRISVTAAGKTWMTLFKSNIDRLKISQQCF